MNNKLIFLDIDGTLTPAGSSRKSPLPRNTKPPACAGVSLVQEWRWEAELNRCKRICSPLRSRVLLAFIKK